MDTVTPPRQKELMSFLELLDFALVPSSLMRRRKIDSDNGIRPQGYVDAVGTEILRLVVYGELGVLAYQMIFN